MLRTAFLPFGFTSAVIVSPLFALAFGWPVWLHVMVVSLHCVAVLFGNIIYQLAKDNHNGL